MNNIDAKELLARTDISTVVGRYVSLKKRGAELAGICPFHNDTKPSLWVNDKKGIFKCFVCGEGGDAIHFVMKHEGVAFQDALAIIDGGNTAGGAPEKKHIDKTKRPDWRPILPVPEGAANPPREHYRYGAPSMGWRYNGPGGELLGYVMRFNLPDGGKDVLPLTYCSDGNRSEWRWHGWLNPRPIYGLDRLAQRPAAPVLLVEGEKAADAAVKILPNMVAITWPGGSRAIQYIDWRPLAGRKVLIWPDADRAGISAAYHIGAVLQGIAEAVRMVTPAAEWPKGFDAADATWTPEQATDELRTLLGAVPAGRPMFHAPEWLREKWPAASVFYEFPAEPDGRVFYTLLERNESGIIAREVASPKPKPEVPKEPERPAYKEYHPGYVPPINGLDAMPYRPLGYNKSESGQNEFYVYASKPNQVLRMSPGSFSKTGLMQLADLNWWESRFPGRNGLSVEAAAQSVINACYDLGVYDLDNVRGVGAWIDEGRPVLHAGSHLVVDGRPTHFVNIKSRFIYEAGKDFGLRMHKPLEPREAVKALELAKMLRWERPINAYLFIGWAVIAPVCGALYWRPHLWLTGGAGSGKSTAIDILKQLIGKMALHMQAMTTEAGIRQTLASSARPVLFDELDIDNAEQDISRVNSILSLMRGSSSKDGGEIGKGGQGGTAKLYKIRSCFAFASINPQLTAGADKSRVTVLSLLSPPRDQSTEELRDGWGKISKFMLELLTEEYVERFMSRTISLLPTILENAKVFTSAASVVLGERRAGDQLGTIIAGAYSLHSNKVATYEEAAAWLKDKEWVDIRNNERDELALFNHLMQQIVTTETGGTTRVERQVGELIKLAVGTVVDGEVVTRATAGDALRRNGIRVEAADGLFYVSSSNPGIKRMLAKTRWAQDHEKALARLEGAFVHQRARFGDGVSTRAVALPISLLDA